MNEAKLVVDTNVFFSLLLRRDAPARRRFFSDAAHSFYCPRFLFVELFKHKERIAKGTDLSEEDVLECLHELLARMQFVEEGIIPIGTWMEARRLCREVDPKDAALRAKGFERFYEA